MTEPDNREPFGNDRIEELARKAAAALPEPFRSHLASLAIRVADFATPETLAALDIDDRWDLTGLYEGRPLTEQSVWDPADLPAIITLFRQPLLREQRETGVPLETLVAHVLIHEGGHHFGLSDEDMEALEREAD